MLIFIPGTVVVPAVTGINFHSCKKLEYIYVKELSGNTCDVDKDTIEMSKSTAALQYNIVHSKA